MRNKHFIYLLLLLGITHSMYAQTWSPKKNNFNFASLKAQATFSDTSQTIEFQINIKAKAGDTIWAQVSKSGITAARILITKDSLCVMDKINKTYLAYSFQDFSQKTGFNFSFPMVENLLFNNQIIPTEEQDKVKKDTITSLTQQRLNYTLTTSIHSDSLTIRSVHLQRENTEDALQILYRDHKNVGKQNFPWSQYLKIPIDIVNHQYLILDLKYTKVDFTDIKQEFPFSIPNNYVKQN